ncbi:predicted protein [Sclerotinia sclerotiorum 1980 UF-70]|uniref:Uncharacterized protein n=2 Tax=Sclerotinia sclerotiorum (strain ATCC 18683 / 1980 / Ss-1) TaxID=665079 RepID=A0A1D9QHP6_SCLS1|nr:predicted protein [Sclerotinia sclerotiorum 1980 UF-70]APA14421.1 hypothetical protein sscle_12g091910 [Sclerotinia sclerotiorum 1980 UF-70]EDN97206.1 predicted protein [Sclerotinia sclerotiorum 1980 UF-70]
MNSTNTNNIYLGVDSNNESCAEVFAYGKCIPIANTPSTSSQKTLIIIVVFILLIAAFGLAIIAQSVRWYRAQIQKPWDEEKRIADERRMSMTNETYLKGNGIHYPARTSGDWGDEVHLRGGGK